jgi:hypothetical protein
VFDNLGGDSLLDVRKTTSSERMKEKRASPPPLVSGEFLLFSFVLFIVRSNDWFHRSYSDYTLAEFAAGEPR